MRRVKGEELVKIKPFFELAARAAAKATCQRAHCGSVIVKDGKVIGEGYNSPPLDDESRRTCDIEWDTNKRPKNDKTCCVHAEWRAVLSACRQNPEKVAGSTLYFIRVDDDGKFIDSNELICTVCSRLTMEAGVKEFTLWNNNGADIYPLAEYDQKSFEYYKK